jgi:hypothetical protein
MRRTEVFPTHVGVNRVAITSQGKTEEYSPRTWG